MPVLLLAYGDPQAKDLLRKAIEARYGLLPPAIAALHLTFTGRARARLGPVTAWVPVEAAAYFQFPQAMRWDFTVKPLGLPVQRGVEAFDGEHYRILRGGRPAIAANARTDHLRSRLWAVAALLLTPLSESYVKLSVVSEQCFSATHTQMGELARVLLRDDRSIAQVEVDSLNPDTSRQQRFRLLPGVEYHEVNGLRLPRQISAFWDDEPYFEVQPTSADNLVSIPEAVFTLAGEG